MTRKEIKKAIIAHLEKVLEDFVDVLMYLKRGQSTNLSEMCSLVFAKRKAIDMTEQLLKIFQQLVSLKYLYWDEQREHVRTESEPRVLVSGRYAYIHSSARRHDQSAAAQPGKTAAPEQKQN